MHTIRRNGVMVLMLLMAGCGGSSSSSTVKATAGAAMDLRSKTMFNEAAYIPSMCWTKTEGSDGIVHNPCFSCHTRSTEPNYSNDQDLQLSYVFPEYARTNRWTNLFKSRTTQVAAISDSDILSYVRTSNYLGVNNAIIPALLLKSVPKGWDFNGNGIWDGYTPDAFFSFDSEGFDKTPAGAYTGWRAFAYAPFLGTFWPTNGSTDDVLIRLGSAFRSNAAGTFDLTAYKINLAIVEALIKRTDVAIAAVDEKPYGVDLDKNGALGTATKIKYDWAPLEGRNMSFVGQASLQQAAGSIHLAAGLFPEGTEFLHSVRYIDVTGTGEIAMAARMKELRYAKKRSWQNYPELQMAAGAEVKEKYDFPDRLSVFVGDVEQGLSNGQGWVYQGFIEDSGGDLRPQTYEETVYCMGCHSGLGITTDGIFSFGRKKDAGDFRSGWYHWSQKGLKGSIEPTIEIEGAGTYHEYSFYLMYNRAGDELRENTEVYEKFFSPAGVVKADMLKQLHDDVTLLLNPSPQRALLLNKAYQSIVSEQSFIYGRDATITPAVNVHKTVEYGQSTKISKAVNTLSTASRFNAARIAADTSLTLPATSAANSVAVTGAGMAGPDGSVYSVATDGLIYKSSYSMQGVAFPFPDRLTLPVQTIVPLKTIASCYTCHRISYNVPAENLSGRSLYTAPVIGGTENGKLTRLTDSAESDLNPRWSPDGTRIVYVSGPPGSSHLWVMNSDGSNKRQLTTAAGMQAWPEWSPDSSRLLYWEYNATSKRYAIRSIKSDGSFIITLAETTNVLERPVWRPDGQYTAYAEERDGNWDLWVSKSDASKSWRMTSSADMDTSPLWSPDGTKIAYKTAATTGSYNLTEENIISVANGFDAPTIYTWNGPQSIQMSGWSPDGTMIAYTAEAVSGISGKDRISYLVALSEVTLTGSTAQAANSQVLSAVTLGDRGALFSPDGSMVVFWGWDQSYRAVLWLYDVSSKNVRRLTTEGFDYNPRWSPDSKKIVFESNRGGDPDIWVMPVE
ncbi:MAG: PD40 domain-containing protein [Deltaproteobacteria bacterium]|nr:PD40 domain-containing protein [Deltaproteobacteria bacterium]